MRAVAVGLACGLWRAVSPAARSQEPAAPPPPSQAPAQAPAEAPPEPAVIPVAEIATRAKAAEDGIAQIEADLAHDELEDRIEARLPELAAEIESERAKLERGLSGAPTPAELSSLNPYWKGLDDQLSKDEQALADRANELDGRRTSLHEQIDLWSRTREAARGAKAPPAVLDSVSAVLGKLDGAERRVETSRNRILDLATRLADRRAAPKAALERIKASQDELQASLLVRQQVPLWSFRPDAGNLRREFDRVAQTFADAGPVIQNYVTRNWIRVVIHAAIIAALLVVTRRARFTLQSRAPPVPPAVDAAHGSPLDALAHPLASALTLGMALVFFIYPGAPPAFPTLLALVQLPAWIVALRRMLPDALHPPLYGLALLAWTDVARTYLQPFELLHRILLLVLLGGGLAGVIWLRRPARLGQIASLVGGRFWLGVLNTWLRIGGWVLAAGLLGAVLGYSNLADLLAILLLRGSYVGSMLFAAVRISEATAEAFASRGSFDRLRMIRDNREQSLAVLRRGLRAIGLASWIALLLSRARLLDPILGTTAEVLAADVEVGAFAFSLGGLLAFALTLWISWRLGRFLSFVLDHEVFPRVQLPSGVPLALSTFSRYTVLVLGFLIAISMLGFSIDRITLMVSALGVGIGFGLQNLVNNFVSGIMLLFERPVRVGDNVQLDDLIGLVTHIGIRASKVHTFDGADVIVPNGDFISARVINWTLADKQRRVVLPVRVAYGTKPRRVLEVLQRIGSSHPEVLAHPAPEALFRGFGESWLDFELRAWTESPRGWPAISSDLAVATAEAFEEAGIEIPYPQRDLHLRSIVPEVREALTGSKTRREPEER